MTNQLTAKERELILQEIESINTRIDRCIEYQKSSLPFCTSEYKEDMRITGSILLQIKNQLKSIIINNKF
jgi:hypothetical protein